MTVEMIRETLLWCTIINAGMLLIWWFGFLMLHDMIHRLHGKWFKLSAEQFDAIHYAGMAFYKIAIFMFNLVPYIALNIVWR